MSQKPNCCLKVNTIPLEQRNVCCRGKKTVIDLHDLVKTLKHKKAEWPVTFFPDRVMWTRTDKQTVDSPAMPSVCKSLFL